MTKISKILNNCFKICFIDELIKNWIVHLWDVLRETRKLFCKFFVNLRTNVKITILLAIEIWNWNSSFNIDALEISVAFRDTSKGFRKNIEICVWLRREETGFYNHQYFFNDMSPDFIGFIFRFLFWLSFKFICFGQVITDLFPVWFYYWCQIV